MPGEMNSWSIEHMTKIRTIDQLRKDLYEQNEINKRAHLAALITQFESSVIDCLKADTTVSVMMPNIFDEDVKKAFLKRINDAGYKQVAGGDWIVASTHD